jgi:hypothetical protein
MKFEVDRSVPGSSPERNEHGDVVPGARLLVDVPDLAALIRLAHRHDSIRVLPPRQDREPQLYRLELWG